MATKHPSNEEELPKQRTCGTMPVHERLLRSDPNYLRARTESENRALEFLRRGGPQLRTGITIIPAVVHVVYNTAAQNISDAQINSQIDVLNKDYRMANADIASIPAPFQALAADARIEFELATIDPNGNPTDGITRTHTATINFSDDDKVKSAATGGVDAWPADKYLNLWVCQLSGGLLGYAQFPGGAAATDGVVILHSAFGTNGTAAAPFNLGRTATHEIGHWLNLRHIWGDDGTGCNGSDFVNDTPNQAGPNYGTPPFPHVTCNNGPNGDLFMDYMDYVDDNAMFMFTQGQVDRMQACLDGDRNSIGHTKPVSTLTIVDQPTLATQDLGTLATIDHPTLATQDLGTLATIDHPTLAALDFGTLATIDHIGTLKNIDDVKMPVLDKSPQTDFAKSPAGDLGLPIGGNLGPLTLGQGVSPFVLSTPHHSLAWASTFRDQAAQEANAILNQLQQYEIALNSYAQADAAGQLSVVDKQQSDALRQTYQALLSQYRQLLASMG